jgi:MFS family permease
VKGRINLVAAAFALTALTYGLGRFAYGLLLPHIREDLSLSATGAGWIGGSAFAAYCFGIVFALVAGARLGERRVAVLASLTATCGLALVAVASSGWRSRSRG